MEQQSENNNICKDNDGKSRKEELIVSVGSSVLTNKLTQKNFE